MQRKLIKVGTSAAILVPKAVLEEEGLKIGDLVHADISKWSKKHEKQDINPEVLAWTAKIRKRYQPMLKKLASS